MSGVVQSAEEVPSLAVGVIVGVWRQHFVVGLRFGGVFRDQGLDISFYRSCLLLGFLKVRTKVTKEIACIVLHRKSILSRFSADDFLKNHQS